jgi:hypothetical protein
MINHTGRRNPSLNSPPTIIYHRSGQLHLTIQLNYSCSQKPRNQHHVFSPRTMPSPQFENPHPILLKRACTEVARGPDKIRNRRDCRRSNETRGSLRFCGISQHSTSYPSTRLKLLGENRTIVCRLSRGCVQPRGRCERAGLGCLGGACLVSFGEGEVF